MAVADFMPVAVSARYAAIYERLIERARVRELVGYVERHHVLPKCMGGTNACNNIVLLTAEEHYVAHQVLVKMYPDVPGLATAAVRMAKQCTGNKAYAWLRKRHAARVSEWSRGNTFNAGRVRPESERQKISQSTKGRVKSAETKDRMSAAQRGNKNALGLKRGPPSAEHRKKNGDARRGKPVAPEVRAMISATLKGKKKSPEHAAKIAAAVRARHADKSPRHYTIVDTKRP
jgi:hypothetical protein